MGTFVVCQKELYVLEHRVEGGYFILNAAIISFQQTGWFLFCF